MNSSELNTYENILCNIRAMPYRATYPYIPYYAFKYMYFPTLGDVPVMSIETIIIPYARAIRGLSISRIMYIYEALRCLPLQVGRNLE